MPSLNRSSAEERIRRRILRLRAQADANAKLRASFYTDRVEDVSRDEIIRRDGQDCHICGEWVSIHDLTLDHIIPLKKGGTHTADNIRVAHRSCNSRKGSRSMKEIQSCVTKHSAR
jgi:5-methylcytosine-specific restriction endonuclease McrA